MLILEPVYLYLQRHYVTNADSKIDGQYGPASHYNYCSNKLMEVICQRWTRQVCSTSIFKHLFHVCSNKATHSAITRYLSLLLKSPQQSYTLTCAHTYTQAKRGPHTDRLSHGCAHTNFLWILTALLKYMIHCILHLC